jgi:hypothetical protein
MAAASSTESVYMPFEPGILGFQLAQWARSVTMVQVYLLYHA